MLAEGEPTLTNYDSPNTTNTKTKSSLVPIFVLCDTCYWCATYFDKSRIPADNICPHCGANNNAISHQMNHSQSTITRNMVVNMADVYRSQARLILLYHLQDRNIIRSANIFLKILHQESLNYSGYRVG